MSPHLIENAKIVSLLPPAADAAGRTGDYVSLKGYARVFIIAHINQGAANTVALTPFQATNVAAAGEKVIPAVPIWACLDAVASDALARQADAANFTTDAGVKDKIIVFEIDAAKLDVDGGFDCVCLKTGASIASNITEAKAILVGARYGQVTPPSAIVD